MNMVVSAAQDSVGSRSDSVQQAGSFHEDAMLEGPPWRGTADVDGRFSQQRPGNADMQNERGRVARELHDGILQSLSGATMHLEVVARLIQADPAAAEHRLREITRMLSEQQRELRNWIGQFHPATPQPAASASEIRDSLDELRQRAQWQYGVPVELRVAWHGGVPRALKDEICRIVQEGLTNIGKHARASAAQVSMRFAVDRVEIVVSDDGVGFPFHGRFGLADLARRQIGPVSLRERIASLHGSLMLTSTSSGSRLEVSVPIDAS